MPSEAHVAGHFGSREIQTHAARLGMWLFLATEILLFTGLFTGYALYRFVYPSVFDAASRHLDLWLGTTNTVILITSSLTVALALHFVRLDRLLASFVCLGLSIGCGLAFLGIKAIEYQHKFQEGALPGKFYSYEAVQGEGASMFFTLYFLMTGLHAIHVIVGLAVLGWVAFGLMMGRFSSAYHTPVEMGGLYWHLVDLVWIFLFPLLYLA